MRSVWGPVLVPLLGAVMGCEALWGSYAYPNPESCQPNPQSCSAGWECNLQSEVCEPTASPPTVSTYTWLQQAKLLASDSTGGDALGTAISLSADTALIGSPNAVVNGTTFSGAAYVFVRDPALGSWSSQAQLVASDFNTGDRFGSSVALSGDTALIGAYAVDLGGTGGAGAAYVFVRDPSKNSFLPQAKLTASDFSGGDTFGRAVALAGDTALIGARLADAGGQMDSGAAYVFIRQPGTGTWVEQTPRLTASDGMAGDLFGYSVALSGDTVLIGAPAGMTAPGAAYVFVRDQNTGRWSQQAKLLSSDRKPGDQFGFAVALSGDTALVGTPSYADGSNLAAGAAYVFGRDAASGAWVERARLLAADSAAGNSFGWHVALNDSWAAVGALNAPVAGSINAGAVYVLERPVGTATWASAAQLRLTAADATAKDLAGSAVTLYGDTLGVGVPGKENGSRMDVGAGYIFQRFRHNGSPCTATTQCSSGFCVDGVCCDSACGGGDDSDCQACSAAAGAPVSPLSDGTCRASRPGRLCRLSRGDSDAPEGCDGESLSCPLDR